MEEVNQQKKFSIPKPKHRNNTDYLAFGKMLATPTEGDEVCISGISGYFPECNSVLEFGEKLINKIDMVTCDNRRWECSHPEIPMRAGKISKLSKFDAGFFGVHYRQAHMMDPMVRMLLERSVEAIMDAGVNPEDLEGTNTGVYIGVCFSETEKILFNHKLEPESYALTGCTRSMNSNWISYFLKIQGPSCILDAASGSSMHAIEKAYCDIRTGKCEQAIAGGISLCLQPMIALLFARLGVLSLDGRCKSFDRDGNGYARSEGVCVVFLRKLKDCKRVYAKVIHAKTNCDGYKENGITFPSHEEQANLFDEFYKECNIPPTCHSYVEAHAAGTKVGDPQELASIAKIFCEGRNRPLPIGSVKSNIGHPEAVSGLCSITKVIIAMERGIIPPNLHYKNPREEAPALVDGRMFVVTEPMPLNDDPVLVGVNNFGVGGANGHILLSWNEKTKMHSSKPIDDLPRIVCISGRVEEAIGSIIDCVVKSEFDAELVGLVHNIFSKDIKGHRFRGYGILGHDTKLKQSVSEYSVKTPLYLIFGEIIKDWSQLANDLFVLPRAAALLERIHNSLRSKAVDIKGVLKHKNACSKISNEVLQTVTLQITLADLLTTLGVRPHKVEATSLGVLAKAYFEGKLDLEATLLIAYDIACILEENLGNQGIVVEGDTQYQTAVYIYRSKIIQHLNSLLINNNETKGINCLIDGFQTMKIDLPSSTSVVLQVGATKTNLTTGPTLLAFEASSKESGLIHILETFGRLYECGHNLDLMSIYPKVHFPVSRSTPMLSQAIKWNHQDDWFVAYYDNQEKTKRGERKIIVSVKENDWIFVKGHVIDGRTLFPATGYIYIVMKTMAEMMGRLTSDLQIVFEDVQFKRAIFITAKNPCLEFIVQIQRGSGNFEIIQDGNELVSGKVYLTSTINYEFHILPTPTRIEEVDCYLLKEEDIYKEFRLRGYNFSGCFRSLKQCDNSMSQGLVHWDGNWITFIDSMIQMQFLKMDTRQLYVPTTIKKIVIDSTKHIQFAKEMGENNSLLPVYVSSDARTITSGGIQMMQIFASCINRQRPVSDSILEKYVFIPNALILSTELALQIDLQLIFENHLGTSLKIVEVTNETINSEPLAPLVHSIIERTPLVQAEILIISKNKYAIQGVIVEDKQLSTKTGISLVILNSASKNPKLLAEAFQALKPNGFILSRECEDVSEKAFDVDMEVLTIYRSHEEGLVLLRKKQKRENVAAVQISNNYSRWLRQLQNIMKRNKKVIIYAQEEDFSGILGFYTCLRQEPGGCNVRCVFISDSSAPKFDENLDFYKKQLQKDLSVNVYKDGCWGTYRHLPIDDNQTVYAEQCYIMPCMRYPYLHCIKGQLTMDTALSSEFCFVTVYYAALKIFDASSNTQNLAHLLKINRIEKDGTECLEYVGRNQTGKRVMGVTPAKGIATVVGADANLLMEIPDFLSMEEAVTVLVPYLTVVYALVLRTRIKKGDVILIHDSTGDIGQAAINLCLNIGCVVFVTASNQQHKTFLSKQYPSVKVCYIKSYDDVNINKIIMKQTKGRGVDFVLNSIPQLRLLAPIHCLAPGGHFLQIGKVDHFTDDPLSMFLFAKGCSFVGINLNEIFNASRSEKVSLIEEVKKEIWFGTVKPLPRHVFNLNEMKKAVELMRTANINEKVILKLRDEEEETTLNPEKLLFKSETRYFCDKNYTYIIVGGLGGFGLELVDWIILRGAKHVVISSRSGIKNSYQAYRIRIWENYGVRVNISTADVGTEDGCRQLLEDAKQLAPIAGIFNVALVLESGILENQNINNFRATLVPKAFATQHLDKLSRTMCPELQHFVVFSSLSCGRGLAGQTNYGMANSIMERICETRRKEGLPGLAIQWGPIGDVGVLAEANNQRILAGTAWQPLSDCLRCMDIFLNQPNAVVSSMIVAQKRGYSTNNIVECIANVIGIRDLRTISFHSTLAELGMDSLTATEINQILKSDFEVSLTAQELKSLTFARLQEINDENNAEGARNCANTSIQEMVLKRLPTNYKSKNISEDGNVLFTVEKQALIDNSARGLRQL